MVSDPVHSSTDIVVVVQAFSALESLTLLLRPLFDTQDVYR